MDLIILCPLTATPPQAVFSVLFPNPEVYLVAKVEKVLHGTIQQCAEPYQKSGGDVKKVCWEGVWFGRREGCGLEEGL